MDTILDQMFKAGVHFGYSRSSRHPSMKSTIYGTKNRVDIINLEETVIHLDRVKELLKGLSLGGKKVLFVGTKNEAKGVTKAAAEALDMPYVVERWVGGIFTNFSEIKKRIARMKDLASKKEKGELDVYTKKERLILQWEEDRLIKLFGGLADMTERPAVLIVVDPKKEKNTIAEAKKVGVPVIAIMNTDCEYADADYPIPANDSSTASIGLILAELVAAYRNK